MSLGLFGRLDGDPLGDQGHFDFVADLLFDRKHHLGLDRLVDVLLDPRHLLFDVAAHGLAASMWRKVTATCMVFQPPVLNSSG